MPTPSEEFPCRTKEVDREKFDVDIFDADGSKRMSTSYESRERCEKWIKALQEINPSLYAKITKRHWKETICVECGQEVDVW